MVFWLEYRHMSSIVVKYKIIKQFEDTRYERTKK